MCGIIGIIGSQNAGELVKQGLMLLKKRGRDGCGIATQDKISISKDPQDIAAPTGSRIVLGHTLHAVVNSVPQPLKGKGTLIANCEIYNWKDIDPHAANDAQVLLDILDAHGTAGLDKLDGVYALAYLCDNKLLLARDILGEKPIWYSTTMDTVAFCSEKKVLLELGFAHVQELNPRHILHIDVKTVEVQKIIRPFFSSEPALNEDEQRMQNTARQLLTRAITKRIPNSKFALLFSGGIDSTFIAVTLKSLGYKVPCYTVSIQGNTDAKDSVWAKRAAERFDFDWHHLQLTRDDIEKMIPIVAPLIEDSNVVKVCVALTFYVACKQAALDGCKVIFSGLGSEEIFAGYERHTKTNDINKECVHGLLKMYERDLYRDDVITMSNGIELRLPFLDVDLICYALRIPAQFKIAHGLGKMILRKAAMDIGIDKEFAMRPKSAAQYGSGVDKAIGALAKKQHLSKSAYLKQFYAAANVKLAILFSGGKDSTYAAYIMKKQNYELACFVTIRSKNQHSYMFHTPAIELTSLQTQAMNIPHIIHNSAGEKESELEDLHKALHEAKSTYGIEGVVSGALFSTYQRNRIERLCDELGLKIFAPLWHKPQEQEMDELLQSGFSFILTSVAADGLDASWLGRIITQQDIAKLRKLHEKNGLNVAGEGGEYESLVIDCPLFTKKIDVKFDVVQDDAHSAHVVITTAELKTKP